MAPSLTEGRQAFKFHVHWHSDLTNLMLITYTFLQLFKSY